MNLLQLLVDLGHIALNVGVGKPPEPEIMMKLLTFNLIKGFQTSFLPWTPPSSTSLGWNGNYFRNRWTISSLCLPLRIKGLSFSFKEGLPFLCVGRMEGCTWLILFMHMMHNLWYGGKRQLRDEDTDITIGLSIECTIFFNQFNENMIDIFCFSF